MRWLRQLFCSHTYVLAESEVTERFMGCVIIKHTEWCGDCGKAFPRGLSVGDEWDKGVGV